jgi:hypothetical protein
MFATHSAIDKLLNRVATQTLDKLTHFVVRNAKPVNLLVVSQVIKKCPSLELLHLIVRAGFYTYENPPSHEINNTQSTHNKKKSIHINDLLAHNGSDRLRSFFTHVSGFDSVTLTNIDALTDSVLNEVASSSPGLKSLIVENCGDMFSYNSIYQILVSCKDLQVLSLVGAHQLGNHRLIELLALPHNLTSLTLSHHNSLDANTLRAILQTSPSVRVLGGLQFRLALKDEVQKWVKETNRDVQFVN